MPDVVSGRARYRRILRFAARHLAVTWWYEILLPTIGLRRIAERTRAARMKRFARKFRVLAVDLGGLMIKLGQFMSSRLDVLPPEITKELEDLQDEVPPCRSTPSAPSLSRNWGCRLSRSSPRSTSSPSRPPRWGRRTAPRCPHATRRTSGFPGAVIKVQRPGIGAIVDVDLAALRKVGGWLSRVRLVYNRVDMPALVEEFAHDEP